LMMMITLLCVGIIPFVGASTHGIEKSMPEAGLWPVAGTQVMGARYRVTLNGFRVVHETYDTAFETDGKGDEVFIVSEAGSIDLTGAVAQRLSRGSLTYGDINGFPDRRQAGFRSDRGGLKTGDSYLPSRNLSQPRPAGAQIFNDKIPLILWEGGLTGDQNAVVIMPTIWEWDNRSINFPTPGGAIPHDVSPTYVLRHGFDDWLVGGFGQHIVRNIRTTLRTAFAGGVAEIGWTRVRSNADIFRMGTNGTRVIGLRESDVNGTDVFEPKVLILTYAAAEQALRSRSGMFQLAYAEPTCCGLEGSYTLYLQVERLP
jgi:hypothetical protein